MHWQQTFPTFTNIAFHYLTFWVKLFWTLECDFPEKKELTTIWIAPAKSRSATVIGNQKSFKLASVFGFLRLCCAFFAYSFSIHVCACLQTSHLCYAPLKKGFAHLLKLLEYKRLLGTAKPSSQPVIAVFKVGQIRSAQYQG